MVKSSRAVVVTTEVRGVFFGYLNGKQSGDTLTLSNARMCIYWSSDMRGVLGLASIGPSNSCKISPAVPSITLNKVTSIMEATPEAISKWENAPWQK